MALSLVACGGDSEGGNSENTGIANDSGDNKDSKDDKKEQPVKKTSELYTYILGQEQNHTLYEYIVTIILYNFNLNFVE